MTPQDSQTITAEQRSIIRRRVIEVAARKPSTPYEALRAALNQGQGND